MNPSQNIPGPSHQQPYPHQPQQHSQNAHHPQGPPDDVTKLIRLFRGFTNLCQKENPSATPRVLKAIEQLVHGMISAREYESTVTQLVGHGSQANLVQFLEKAMPLLRAEIETGRISVEQIIGRPRGSTTDSPSPQSGHGATASPQSLSGRSPLQKPTHSPMQPPNSEPNMRAKLTESPLNHPPSSAPMFDGTLTQEQQQQISLAKIEPGSFQQPSTSQPMQVDNRQIPSTQGVEVSYKEISQEQNNGDKSIFDRQSFAARLHQKMPECASFEENALIILSDFLEAKLRDVLNGTLFAAEHRLEQLQHNPTFVPINDPKKQLLVIEKHEKAEKLRRENLEKEAILKMSKGKSKDSDVMEKAKQIRKADEETMLNKQTNEAAKAALSGTKRQWAKTASAPAANLTRPRKRQVTMRDLMYVFERDPIARNTPVYRKMLYGLSTE